jgi:glycosyltransferase involved in cell wall biosynthesis
MLVGELAMAGRLNWRTFGYEFVHTILPGALATKAQITEQKKRVSLSRHGVGEHDAVILWCGGYNAWTDVDTLFAALELAMSKEARLHFVSVGANSYQAPDNVYTRLLGLIEKSPFRDRFHVLGWRPWAEIPDYYRECDVGLNIDAIHYETVYGTRTRLLEMMAAGLPVITSLGSELSYLLHDSGNCLAFEAGDWQGLAEQILTIVGDNDLRLSLAKAAHQYASNELSFPTTTTSIRRWVRQPSQAPDKVTADFSSQVRQIEYQARSVVRRLIWRFAGLDK